MTLDNMYTVIIKATTEDDPIPPDYSKPFDRARFFGLIGEFG